MPLLLNVEKNIPEWSSCVELWHLWLWLTTYAHNDTAYGNNMMTDDQNYNNKSVEYN
jgi:hypothetical protein